MANNVSYFHRFHRWSVSKFQNFFETAPKQLLNKYTLVKNKEKDKVRMIDNHIRNLEAKNEICKKQSRSLIDTTSKFKNLISNINQTGVKNTTSKDSGADLFDKISKYMYLNVLVKILSLIPILVYGYYLPSEKYCVLLKTLEKSKLNKHFVNIYYNRNPPDFGYFYAYLDDESQVVRGPFEFDRAEETRSDEKNIAASELMELLNRFSRGIKQTQENLRKILIATKYLRHTKSSPKVIYCWDDTIKPTLREGFFKNMSKCITTLPARISSDEENYLDSDQNRSDSKTVAGVLVNNLKLDTYSYTDIYLMSLLHYHLWEKTAIIPYDQMQPESKSRLESNTSVILKTLKKSYVVVAPIYLNGDHWVGMVLKITNKPKQCLNIIYVDPTGAPFKSMSQHPLVKKIRELYVDFNLIDLEIKQSDNRDSGPFTVDNLIRIASSKIKSYDKKCITSLLERGSSRVLRIEQYNTMQTLLLAYPFLIDRVSGAAEAKFKQLRRAVSSSNATLSSQISLSEYKPWRSFRSYAEETLLHENDEEILLELFNKSRNIIKSIYSEVPWSKKKSFPTVFVSYAWPNIQTSEKFRNDNWTQLFIMKFVLDLNLAGIRAILDLRDSKLGSNMTDFMQKGIQKSDFVLLFGTPTYKEKCEGMYNYESCVRTEFSMIKKRIGSDRIARREDTVIPVMLSGRAMPDAFPAKIVGELAIGSFCESASYLTMLHTLLYNFLQIINRKYIRITEKTNLSYYLIDYNELWRSYLNDQLKHHTKRLKKADVLEKLKAWRDECKKSETDALDHPGLLIEELKRSYVSNVLIPFRELNKKEMSSLNKQLLQRDNKLSLSTLSFTSSQMIVNHSPGRESSLTKNGLFSLHSTHPRSERISPPRFHYSETEKSNTVARNIPQQR